MKTITGNYAQILQNHRSRYNARFAEARHFYPLLEPQAFGEHLTATVAPIVEAVQAAAPERAESVADELYDLSLELVGREFLGMHSHYPAVNSGWQTLLPALARFVANSPAQVVGAVTNALYNLSRTAGARPSEWITRMMRLLPLCQTESDLLRAGQITAWLCGMAHYRLNALDLCQTMPFALVREVLKLGAQAQAADWPVILERLQTDPWLEPGNALSNRPRRLQLAANAGGFRGFGGLFLTPPIVTGCDGPAFLVDEGGQTWRLYADRFGASLLKAEPTAQASLRQPDGPPLRLSVGGEVQSGYERRVFPQLRNSTGNASSGSTLAVSTGFSHWIYLVAWIEGEG